jgi:hypothetical protein
MEFRQSEQHVISGAKAILSNGTEIVLSETVLGSKKQSQCLFFKRQYGEFTIRLRLDYSDRDKENNPRLDVDIERNENSYRMDREKWHHTDKKLENGAWIYSWRPDTNQLKESIGEITFILETRNNRHQTGKAAIVK